MPAHDPQVRRVSSSLAATVRWHPDADITEARGDLQAAKLEAHIRQTVDGWPPLTPEQRERLSLLLHPGGDHAT